jgi:hypothetical protein
MSQKFLPESDEQFRQVAESFARSIANDPERFNVSAEDSDYLSRVVQRFSDAMRKSAPAGTKNRVAVVGKNQARKEAASLIRTIANMIRADVTISAADKVAVHIKQRPTKTHRRRCPNTAPALRLKARTDLNCSGGVQHVIEFRDGFATGDISHLGLRSMTGRRAKPPGVVRIELYFDVIDPNAEPPTHPSQASTGWPMYLQSFTRSPMVVEFPLPAAPMRIVYWARWAGSTGEQGPWSQTLATTTEGGYVTRVALANSRYPQQLHLDPARLESARRALTGEAVGAATARAAVPALPNHAADPRRLEQQKLIIMSARRELPDRVETIDTLHAESSRVLQEKPASDAA